MRTRLILLCVAAFASCGASPPQGCSLDGKQVLKCAAEHDQDSEGEMLVACLPFSKPQLITGAWVYGFEHNSFFSGKRASAKLLRSFPIGTELEVKHSIPDDGRLRVFQVEVIGRRSLCDMGFPKHIIVADRVLSQSLVAISR